MFVFWQRDMILHGTISIQQIWVHDWWCLWMHFSAHFCIYFIFACERRSPKSVSRKTFLFFLFSHFSYPPPSPPPRTISFTGAFLHYSWEMGSILRPPYKIMSMIMQWNNTVSWHSPCRIHFKFLMTASISRTFWWYCVLSLKRWFWIQSPWIKPCLYSVSFPIAIIDTEMTTPTKKGSALPVSILNERHPLFYEANVFFYDFCLTI